MTDVERQLALRVWCPKCGQEPGRECESSFLKVHEDRIDLGKDSLKDTRIKKLPAVVLINPKYPHNVGAAVRACAVWDVPTLRWTGDRVRVDDPENRLPREERMRDYQNVDFKRAPKKILDWIPVDAVPVAIEVRENAEKLPNFIHPENAVYVFGQEDGGIPKGFLHVCHRFLVIPTIHCLNLAAAINVVLYDRQNKLGWQELDKRLGDRKTG